MNQKEFFQRFDRCETCRWFASAFVELEKFGHCGRFNGGDANALAWTDGGDYLRCKPQFGCVCWEPSRKPQ